MHLQKVAQNAEHKVVHCYPTNTRAARWKPAKPRYPTAGGLGGAGVRLHTQPAPDQTVGDPKPPCAAAAGSYPPEKKLWLLLRGAGLMQGGFSQVKAALQRSQDAGVGGAGILTCLLVQKDLLRGVTFALSSSSPHIQVQNSCC